MSPYHVHLLDMAATASSVMFVPAYLETYIDGGEPSM